MFLSLVTSFLDLPLVVLEHCFWAFCPHSLTKGELGDLCAIVRENCARNVHFSVVIPKDMTKLLDTRAPVYDW